MGAAELAQVVVPKTTQTIPFPALDLDVPSSQLDVKPPETPVLQFVPSIRSGSFADIGPRRYMEDEHIRIDDLSAHLGSLITFPQPSAFYGVFDGHGGPEAAAYVRKNAIRFFFEDPKFPQTSQLNDAFLLEVENCLRKGFLLADMALAEDSSVSTSSGTTALTALVIGRYISLLTLFINWISLRKLLLLTKNGWYNTS